MAKCTSGVVDPLWGSNFVEVAGRDGITMLTLCGELDLWMATLVRKRFDDLEGGVLVECAGLTFIDAAGINLLLEMDQTCRARGAKLSVMNPPHCVTRLLSLVQLDGVFDIRSQAIGR